ncbi:ABC transporter substrate-binding protein [Thalassococcus sp. S3]|uniref:ABC transporter substrate-binding protein n=1 Tax=Thalassococcus sp. S3 TaxID=2017482 RepID=UPI00102CF966|nr:ABC transporter substrate-binding protein [Thalassococcus sp. S3]
MKQVFWPLAALLCAFAGPSVALDCGSGMRAFSHLGGETCIPEKAERIVALHDLTITLSLVELDAPVVGSTGRIDADNQLYIRSVDLLFGLDFENSGITYVGTFDAVDYEVLAALQPDLIIGRDFQLDSREQFEVVAPTVFVSDDPTDPMATPRAIAEAAGLTERYEQLLTIYEANLERARFALPDVKGATYSKISAWDGQLFAFAGYRGLTKVLADLGFVRGAIGQEMADRGVAQQTVSVELLPELEADYLFDTYSIAYGARLADPAALLNQAVPGWCDFLTTCSAGRYIVLPREYSSGYSFVQLNMLLQLITTNVANAPPVEG